MLPLNDTDFWWLRYGLGLALPIVFFIASAASFIARHSYAIWRSMSGGELELIPVQGEQASLMGAAYLGIAMMLFAHYYAQYHDKMGFYYEQILAPGAILAGGGILWCSWIFLAR